MYERGPTKSRKGNNASGDPFVRPCVVCISGSIYIFQTIMSVRLSKNKPKLGANHKYSSSSGHFL